MSPHQATHGLPAVVPSRAELEDVFHQKHGDPTKVGWGPRTRFNAGYFTPDEYYEALVAKLVTAGSAWLDVGGGRDVFPSNKNLATELAARCRRLVAVDPSDTVSENPFAHERVKAFIQDYSSAESFDVATLRMVAEHINAPESCVAALARLVRPGGVVVYTINKWSPVSMAAWLIPFWLHHPLKSVLWGTEEKDTFPVAYRMNTRGRLRSLFSKAGFREQYFAYLDDCRTFHPMRLLHSLELLLWRLLNAADIHYPENCLLGVYTRR